MMKIQIAHFEIEFFFPNYFQNSAALILQLPILIKNNKEINHCTMHKNDKNSYVRDIYIKLINTKLLFYHTHTIK